MYQDLRLNKYNLGELELFITGNTPLDFNSQLCNFKENKLMPYLNNAVYNALIDNNAKYKKLEGIAALYAQGAYAKGGFLNHNWVFDDSNRLHKVQDWVDMYDGKYSLLMLFCYTPEILKKESFIYSRKSLLIIPDNGYFKDRKDVQSRLYFPKIGMMDDTEAKKYLTKLINRRSKT